MTSSTRAALATFLIVQVKQLDWSSLHFVMGLQISPLRGDVLMGMPLRSAAPARDRVGRLEARSTRGYFLNPSAVIELRAFGLRAR